MTDQTRLQSLYAQLDQYSAAGEDVVADIRKEINNLELSYLKEEVLPEVTKLLGLRIKKLRCSIDCSIQFNGNAKIDYSFCTSGSMLLVKDSISTNDFKGRNFVIHQESSTFQTERQYKPFSNNVRIVDYSEKAIAVYGETKKFSDEFRSMGGYFNPRLKEGAGWVFSKKRRTQVESLISSTFSQEESSQSLAQEANLSSQAILENFPERSEKEWINHITQLGCNSHLGYQSPHKAIFILTIIEGVRLGYIKDYRIFPTYNVAYHFNKIWKKYVPSGMPFRSNFYQPFVHLCGEDFYSLEAINPKVTYDLNQAWTRATTLRYFKYGILDKTLFSLLNKPGFSSQLEKALIQKYLIQYAPKSNSSSSHVSTSSPASSSNSKRRSALNGFRKYLRSITSKTGKPYSESTISLYSQALCSKFMMSILKKHTDYASVEDISSMDKLKDLQSKIEFEEEKGNVNHTTVIAIRMFIDYRSSNSVQSAKYTTKKESLKLQRELSSTNSFRSYKANPIVIKSITAEHIHITDGNPTSMLVQFINAIGPDLVADMKIKFLGGEFVGLHRHPKYPSKYLDGGYWVNVNSSTTKKIEQIKTICSNLGMRVDIELDDNA